MIPFNDDDFILAAWLIAVPGVRDWFAVVKKKHGVGSWESHAQFQFHQNNEFGPAGYSGGEGGIVKATDDGDLIMIAMENAVHNLLERGFGATSNFYMVNGSPRKLREMMNEHPELSQIKIRGLSLDS